jgi:hypothetical protein
LVGLQFHRFPLQTGNVPRDLLEHHLGPGKFRIRECTPIRVAHIPLGTCPDCR